MAKELSICPVILSGGAGTRLWPLSRRLYPKQLLPLVGDKSMLQQTLLRTSTEKFSKPLIVANEEHRFIIASQLQELGIDSRHIVLEAEGRNTAPAAGVAACILEQTEPDALMLVLPADHVITDMDAFYKAVDSATPAAQEGYLVTFGIQPTEAATGYGYIHMGDGIPSLDGCVVVESFVEKPNREVAQQFLDSGKYVWNSGMFLFSVSSYMHWLKKLEPEVFDVCQQSVSNAEKDQDFLRLSGDILQSKSCSIDYAIMEHADKIAVVPADLGWSDVGAWSELWNLGKKDNEGNVVDGNQNVITEDVQNSYLYSDGPLVAALGIEDAVVVAADHTILVTHKSRAQSVKQLVERLKETPQLKNIPQLNIYRPWGTYKILEQGQKFKVKQLVINPGKRISLQYHNQRSEHWVVVEGKAHVTCDDKTFVLEKNQSTYIPMGATHRLENKEKDILKVIEVQSGDYLGEDDIVRIEDDFQRVS